MTRTKGLIVIIAVLIGGLAFDSWKVLDTSAGLKSTTAALSVTTTRLKRTTAELAAFSHQACVIQARGLPAGHQLSAAMQDFYVLLTARPTDAQKRQSAQAPPTPATLKAFAQLKQHLGIYVRIERKQPATRICK